MQERLTAVSTHLLFFTLELNRLDDAVLEAAMADPALGHYRPWLEDVRKDKPYQLEDRVEQLFHEKSVTGHSAWNRLFDETMPALRFKVGGESLTLEPTLNLLQDPGGEAQGGRRSAGGDLQGESAALRADHQHARQGQGDLRPLARLQATSPTRAISPTASSRRWWMRWSSAVRAAYPRLSHRYYALKARWLGKKKLPHWDRNAPLPQVAQRTIAWDEAQRDRARRLWRLRAEDGGDRRALLRRRAGSTRRRGPASRRAPSRIRPCRRRIPTCC